MNKVVEIWSDTGVVIEREMNANEMAQRESDIAAAVAQRQAEADAAAAAQAAREAAEAKLAALGLTAEEAALLLS